MSTYPCTDGLHWGHPEPGTKSRRTEITAMVTDVHKKYFYLCLIIIVQNKGNIIHTCWSHLKNTNILSNIILEEYYLFFTQTLYCDCTYFYQLHHIRMVQLFQDGNLLIHSLQGSFRRSRTLRSSFGSSWWRSPWWWRRGGSAREEKEKEWPCVFWPISDLFLCHCGNIKHCALCCVDHLVLAADLRGNPACLISLFLDKTFIAYRREGEMV